MHTEDAYAELGLPPGASDAELKTAWRRLVARWHPDRNRRPDASARMQRINLAYMAIRQAREALSGDDHPSAPPSTRAAAPAGKRRRPGAESARPRAAAGGHTHADHHAHAHAAADAAQPEAGHRTVRRKLRLSLEEAALGCTRTVSGRVTLRCTACTDRGWLALDGACADCDGQGAVRRASLFGWLATSEPCAACGGEGRARQACEPCGQRGRRTVTYRRAVRLPPGVRAGDVLTAPGGVHDSTELELELQLEIEPHAFFKLEADGTLRCDMPVNGFAWVGERWVEVPTLTGLQSMRLQREHRSYRLRGQGFPTQRRGPRGDLLIEILPCFPEEPTATQQALLDRLIDETAEHPTEPLADWQRRVRRWTPCNTAASA
jgi:molecular chaperone DnaJ